MKATTYEPGESRVKDDLCDTPTSVTGVTHPSDRRKKPPMLISRYFERCDRSSALKKATSVTDYPTTVTLPLRWRVTVVLPVAEDYWQRLNMSKNKIRSVILPSATALPALCDSCFVWSS